MVPAVAQDSSRREQPHVDELGAVEELAERRQCADLEGGEVGRHLLLGGQPQLRARREPADLAQLEQLGHRDDRQDIPSVVAEQDGLGGLLQRLALPRSRCRSVGARSRCGDERVRPAGRGPDGSSDA